MLSRAASQDEGIAKFAHNVTYEDLTPERRERLKINILDSLACAISAVGPASIKAYFTFFRSYCLAALANDI
jgi:2-methylcitrate dehydratase PrpD